MSSSTNGSSAVNSTMLMIYTLPISGSDYRAITRMDKEWPRILTQMLVPESIDFALVLIYQLSNHVRRKDAWYDFAFQADRSEDLSMNCPSFLQELKLSQNHSLTDIAQGSCSMFCTLQFFHLFFLMIRSLSVNDQHFFLLFLQTTPAKMCRTKRPFSSWMGAGSDVSL